MKKELRLDITAHRASSKANNRVFTLLGMLLLAWVAILILLVCWWAFFLLKQNNQLHFYANLLEANQISSITPIKFASKTMIVSEAVAFVLLIATTGGLFFWLVARELRRTKALQLFFASFAHELRTPLTGMRLQAELIVDDLARGRSISADSINRLIEDSQRLELQVERSLELARLESGAHVQNRCVRLKPLLEQIKNEWLVRYASVQDLSINLHMRDASVWVDPVAFTTVIRNIFENMHRHGRTQGTPLVIDIDVVIQNDHVALSIKDNGRGYEGDISKLGSLFYRGGSSTGTGVGLYLVKTLMESMGARVEFTPKPNFIVTMIMPAVAEAT